MAANHLERMCNIDLQKISCQCSVFVNAQRTELHSQGAVQEQVDYVADKLRLMRVHIALLLS